MAEATLRNETPDQSQAFMRLSSLRTVGTFVIVMVGIIVIWQGIKALFDLDNIILPNIADIANALLPPIQQGKPLLAQILLNSTLFTMREAALGFALGASIGFVLAVLLVHSALFERCLMPFLVASQTVTILAISPMVVVWLEAGWVSIAVIS